MSIPELHPQLLGLLDDARENPDDDTPRLILADWLEEHDHTDLAACVREEVTRARCDDSPDEDAMPQERPASVIQDWEDRLRGYFQSFRFHRGLVQLHAHASLLADVTDPVLLAWVDGLWLETTWESPEIYARIPLLPRVNSLRLTLYEHPFRDDEHACACLHSLSQTRLTQLDLGQGAIGSEFLTELANWPGADRLTLLNLANNALDVQELTILCQSPVLTNVRSLDLRDNQTGDGLGAILTHATHGRKIESLFLGGNGLALNSLRRLAEWPQLARLTELHLAHNNLEEIPLRLLLTGFSTLPEPASLRRLDLSFNRIGTAALTDIATTPNLGNLEELVLTNGNLSREGLHQLGHSPHLPNLRRLRLGGNVLYPGELRTLATSPMIQRLTTLDLHSCRLRDDTASILLEAAPLPNLRWLRLGGNYLSRATRRELVAAFPFTDFGP